MEGFTIETHNFEEAKNQLEKFSKEVSAYTNLSKFDEDCGPFGWFNRDASAKDLNTLTSEIKDSLISIKRTQVDTFEGLGQVYKALEALDKEYIRGIIVAVEAATKASNQAKDAADEAKRNTIDIGQLIKAQDQTIEKLLKFKEQIEKIEYIQNVEKIQNDIQNNKKQIESIQSNINENEKKNAERIEIQEKQLLRKIKIAYTITGIFGVITLTHIILSVFGVM